MNYRIACEVICFASFFFVVSVSRLFETFDYLMRYHVLLVGTFRVLACVAGGQYAGRRRVERPPAAFGSVFAIPVHPS